MTNLSIVQIQKDIPIKDGDIKVAKIEQKDKYAWEESLEAIAGDRMISSEEKVLAE